MRKLTHYELKVLIKNEIYILAKSMQEEAGVHIAYVEARAKDILKYIAEYQTAETTIDD